MAKRTNKAVTKTVAKTVTGMRVERRPLTDFDLSYENMRTTWTEKSEEKADGNSFAELKQSIKLSGQKEPVTARPYKGKLQLIAGRRRFEAIKELAQESKTPLKSTYIDVSIKEMSDLEAYETHVLENTARDNLNGPDLAFAAHGLQERLMLAGINTSTHDVAARLGKNQSYISTLIRIVAGAPEVAKLWRAAPKKANVKQMLAIVKLKSPEIQMREWERIAKPKTEETSGQTGAGGKDLLKSAIDRATKVAGFLGELQFKGLIGEVEIDWSENLPDLGIKLKDGLKPADKRAVAKAAKEAYIKAKSGPDDAPQVPAGK